MKYVCSPQSSLQTKSPRNQRASAHKICRYMHVVEVFKVKSQLTQMSPERPAVAAAGAHSVSRWRKGLGRTTCV